MAAGRRPRQHDARPRRAHRRRARVPAGAAVLHAGRDRRGVRRRPRHRQPDAAAHGDEAGRPRPARASSARWRRRARPISLQRWSVPRVAARGRSSSSSRCSCVAAVCELLVARPSSRSTATPTCGTGDVMILMAQAVPARPRSRASRRCPPGWELGGVEVDDGAGAVLARLGSRRRAVPSRSRLRRPTACAVDGATEVPSDEVGHPPLRASRSAPARLQEHALLPVPRRLRHVRVRVRRRRRARR